MCRSDTDAARSFSLGQLPCLQTSNQISPYDRHHAAPHECKKRLGDSTKYLMWFLNHFGPRLSMLSGTFLDPEHWNGNPLLLPRYVTQNGSFLYFGHILKCAHQWRSYTRAYRGTGTGPGRICLCPGKTSQ